MEKELIKFFDEEANSNVDVCRVSCTQNALCITHYWQVSEKLATLIAERRHSILAEVKAINPHVVHFGVIPEKNGEKTVQCAVLTISVNMIHNSIEELKLLAYFAETINFTILKALQRDIVLRNISLDMAQFDD